MEDFEPKRQLEPKGYGNLHAPPATIIPAEDDDELLDATPDIDVPISTAVSSALAHLEQAIDDMHSASPQSLSFDPLFYLALSSLPLTYPWPILTIDLKNFLPLMDRFFFFFLLYAAWVRSRAERPSVSYTKAVMEVAWTGHNLQLTKTN